MASLPSASTRTVDESAGIATGTDLICVWACVPTSADCVPRFYYGAQAIYDTHGYSQGLDYAAFHMRDSLPKKPVLFIPLPIATPGVVGRIDSSGNTGGSVVTCAVAGTGSLEETDGILKIETGGIVATDQIVLSLSLDGGRTYKQIKLGTAASYVIPYVGLVLSFGPGTLVAGDTVLTWHSTAPLPNDAGIELGKANLAAQDRQVRSWICCWDLSSLSQAESIEDEVNDFEATDERYAIAHCGLRDRLPAAVMSSETVRMSGAPSLTFLEVGATGDTITRSAGSFVTDGFVNGDRITITGSVSNNITDALVTNVAALVLTLDTQDLTNEGPVAGCSLSGTPGITFAEVGATGDTITRNRGSWLADGFRSGDVATIDGTVSNDGTTADIATATALVLTLGSYDLTNEAIGQNLISITAGETDVQCCAALDAEFAAISDSERMNLAYARGAMRSPVTGWKFRRSSAWADCIREYQADIRETTWHKAAGPLTEFDLTDAEGNPYEHDERTTPVALAAGFTCARTWGNGPRGAFIAQSLTRADPNSVLAMNHNKNVANLYQTVVQLTTENFAGAVLTLEPANQLGQRFATQASLAEFNSLVNNELARYLLSNIGGSGSRCSLATWTAAVDDDLGAPDAVLHGSGELEVNGTIVHIQTSVAVR